MLLLVFIIILDLAAAAAVLVLDLADARDFGRRRFFEELGLSRPRALLLPASLFGDDGDDGPREGRRLADGAAAAGNRE